MTPHDPNRETPLDASPGEPLLHPAHIGPYKILQVLGEGGMGVVYEADQTAPVRRRVALKVMKVGMDTREVVARFEAERQALAVMNHPGIAKVFEAGASESGRPYFVMELVKGVPITQYCDGGRFTTRERLSLFVSVCQAVQHAHHKGVIHRDLKPSNVLVTEVDARPVPKIIDFGIAKATGQHLTDKTLVTSYGQAMGTPAYMSPEQAEMSGLDVDTRTDVYSLGVLLYELLVGEVPVDPTEVGVQGFIAQLVRRETDPPTPSARVATLDERRERVAACRGTDPHSLRRQLRGDLDWLVMKAMDKDRARRYETANGLAMDIQRYLADEPIVARPPSAPYRVAKFVRRNQAGVVAASVAAIALLIGAVLATVGMMRANRAEAQARQEAETATQVSDFLVGLFEVSDPSEARGNSITARQVLDKGVSEIRTGLADQPVVQGRLLNVMGRVYRDLGLYTDAQPLLEDALALQRNRGSEESETAKTLREVVLLYLTQGKAAAGLPLIREAVATMEGTLGPDHSETAYSYEVLGRTLRALGEYQEARTHLERSLAIRERTLGPEHRYTASSLAQLGWLAGQLGEYEQAKALYERAIPIAERELGSDDPRLAHFLSDFGGLLAEMREHGAAREYYERALAIRENALGPDHVYVGYTLNNLGALEWGVGDLAAARPYYERALAIHEKALGQESPAYRGTLGNLALLAHRTGSYVEALRLYERLGLEAGAPHRDEVGVANDLNNFGWLLRSIGLFDRADRVLQRALAIRERIHGPQHHLLLDPLTNLSRLARDRGDYAKSREYLERKVAIEQEGSRRSDAPLTLWDLGWVLVLLGQYDAAQPVLDSALSIQPDAPEAIQHLAKLYHKRGEVTTGDSLLARWLDLRAEAAGSDSSWFAFEESVAWAIRGNRARTLERLRTALRRGYRDPWLTQHPDLAFLHGDPAYEAIAATVRRRTGIDRLRQ